MPTRRTILMGLPALLLVGCGSKEEVLASAARGSNRTAFIDTVGWIERAGRSAVLAFVPFRMDDEQRRAVVRGRGVYPALERYEPMVEMRLEFAGLDREDAKVGVGTLSAVQLTFWHFDNPAAVLRDEGRTWSEGAEMTVLGLDGDIRPDGWLIGTVRGQRLIESALGTQSYVWNLGFQSSLS